MSKILLVSLFLITAVAVQAKNAKLTILSFNDIYEILPDAHGRGGFAELQTLLQQERAKSVHHVTTLNGDFLSPSILSIFDKGAHRIDLFNMMGVDVVVPGNHEFDFGPDELLQRIRDSHFPWLAANAIGLNGKPFTGENQTVLIDVDGIKVGIFGLITVETPELSSTEQKVCFAPLVYTARRMIAELKEQGAQVIIVLTHLLIAEDKQLADEVPEIDLILGGHDHDPITWYNDQTLILKSGQNGYYLARIDLYFEQDEQGEVKVFPSWNLILNKDTVKDSLVAKEVDVLQTLLEDMAGKVIGVVHAEFDTLYTNVRSCETKIGNFIADALRESCHAELAIVPGGIIRGNQFYRPGQEISLRDLVTELPFGNSNVLVKITGKEILEALENGVSQVEGKAGRFPQVSGICFAYNVSAPPGQRIRDVYVSGHPLELDRIYAVATVDYVFNGGDGYNMFKGGELIISPLEKVELLGAVVNYIKKHGGLFSELDGRIVVEESNKLLDQTLRLAN